MIEMHFISQDRNVSPRCFENWIFDRLPYADLTTKPSPPPDYAKLTAKIETMKRKNSEEKEVKSKNKNGQERRIKQKGDVRGVDTPINLLLSEFYDSGELFKSYVFNFWPLCIGILNLPPNLRGKVGLSYFFIAVHDVLAQCYVCSNHFFGLSMQ